MKFKLLISQCQNLTEIQMSQYFYLNEKIRADISQLKASVTHAQSN